MKTAGEVIAAFNDFPQTGIITLLDGGRAMILAPHPDDESLGCGGLIAGLCRQAQPPVVVILTDGAASHPGSRRYPPPRLRQLRAGEARAAVALLGLPPGNLVFLDHPDTKLPASGEAFIAAAEAVAALARRLGCTVIIGPWRHDPHCDHEAGAAIAEHVAHLTGARLLFYPVWGWLLASEVKLPVARITGWRLDIAAHLALKQQAIATHASQYTGLIDDSPNGFRLPPALLTVFGRPFEVFIE
jgi:LmbE family N-acetylglucosaminyl deacetylase